MGKAKFVMALVFVLAMGSGLLAGMLVSRFPASNPPAAAPPRTPLAEELRLTAEQSRNMRGIWEGVGEKVDDCFLRAQAAQKQRDEAVYAMMSDEQKARYAKVQEQYAAALAMLKSERDVAFSDAVRKTEEMLSDPQKARYRQLLQSRLGMGMGTVVPDWMSPPSSTMPAAARRAQQNGTDNAEP